MNNQNINLTNKSTFKAHKNWSETNWIYIEKIVNKLQKQIFRLTIKKEQLRVHKIQRLFLRLFLAKQAAIKKILDYDNKITKKNGIKFLTPKEKVSLMKKLQLTSNSKNNLKNMFIEKKNELKSLNISIIKYKAEQILITLVLEPEWEAKFDPNNYGLRIGRSTHDALEAVWMSLYKKEKYILNASIKVCLSKINNEYFLKKFKTFSKLETQISLWWNTNKVYHNKKAFLDENMLQKNKTNSLFVNIALHGIEKKIARIAQNCKTKGSYNKYLRPYHVNTHSKSIRYLNNFLVLSPYLNIIKSIKIGIEKWLKLRGFSLKIEKNSIVNPKKWWNNSLIGFKFLRSEIIHKLEPTILKNKQVKTCKLIIRASKNDQIQHLKNVKNMLKKTYNVVQVIYRLNKIITKWSKFHKTQMNSKIFKIMNHQTWYKLFRWARKKHKQRNADWIYKKYFQKVNGKKRFGYDFNGTWIHEVIHTDIHLKRHVKIRGAKSPYDGDWKYWLRRNKLIIKKNKTFETKITETFV